MKRATHMGACPGFKRTRLALPEILQCFLSLKRLELSTRENEINDEQCFCPAISVLYQPDRDLQFCRLVLLWGLLQSKIGHVKGCKEVLGSRQKLLELCVPQHGVGQLVLAVTMLYA